MTAPTTPPVTPDAAKAPTAAPKSSSKADLPITKAEAAKLFSIAECDVLSIQETADSVIVTTKTGSRRVAPKVKA